MTTTNRFPLHRNNTALPMVLLLAVVALLQSNGLVLGFSVALPAIRHSRTTSSTTGTSTPPQYSSQRNASPSLVLLQMGLFDGMKEAFSAPALERTTIDAERETPIDRWMGWSVAKENTNNSEGGTAMAVAQTGAL